MSKEETYEEVFQFIGPENIKVIDGEMHYTREGARRLAEAVATGKLEGDKEAAMDLLAFIYANSEPEEDAK